LESKRRGQFPKKMVLCTTHKIVSSSDIEIIQEMFTAEIPIPVQKGYSKETKHLVWETLVKIEYSIEKEQYFQALILVSKLLHDYVIGPQKRLEMLSSWLFQRLHIERYDMSLKELRRMEEYIVFEELVEICDKYEKQIKKHIRENITFEIEDKDFETLFYLVKRIAYPADFNIYTFYDVSQIKISGNMSVMKEYLSFLFDNILKNEVISTTLPHPYPKTIDEFFVKVPLSLKLSREYQSLGSMKRKMKRLRKYRYGVNENVQRKLDREHSRVSKAYANTKRIVLKKLASMEKTKLGELIDSWNDHWLASIRMVIFSDNIKDLEKTILRSNTILTGESCSPSILCDRAKKLFFSRRSPSILVVTLYDDGNNFAVE